jgi:anaerobic magnesium-protoporphyrin IX monomethyl ester cyclase
LPYPDRDLFNFGEMMNDFGEAEFMGSRGCPYKCAYCVNHALQDLFKGKGPYVRFRSIDNLMGEIAEVVKRYPQIGLLGFHDDTFTLKRAWLEEFAEKYPKNFKLPFWCNATANSISKETAGLLKKAGCFEVRIGVESGNDRIRDQILDKHVSHEEIVQAFRFLREAGIKTYAFNMIGLPFETVETVYDTIRINREVKPSQMFCSIFYPYPGTKAYMVCRENGWLTGRTVSSYFENDYAVNQPSISRKDVIFYHDIFRELVSFPGLEWLIKIMMRIPVTRNKSLWNVWRRILVKCKEFANYFRLKLGLPARGPEIWRGWKK